MRVRLFGWARRRAHSSGLVWVHETAGRTGWRRPLAVLSLLGLLACAGCSDGPDPVGKAAGPGTAQAASAPRAVDPLEPAARTARMEAVSPGSASGSDPVAEVLSAVPEVQAIEPIRSPAIAESGSPLVHAPGYVPPEDPEADAVARGRRFVAEHDLQFTGGETSAETLALAILEALRTGNREALQELRITLDEFRTILWPEFPQSRPITRIQPEDSWTFLDRTCAAGMNQALSEYAGRDLRLDRIGYGAGQALYTNFSLYHEVVLHVLDPEGSPHELTFAHSFVERHGRWKVYMYED